MSHLFKETEQGEKDKQQKVKCSYWDCPFYLGSETFISPFLSLLCSPGSSTEWVPCVCSPENIQEIVRIVNGRPEGEMKVWQHKLVRIF